MVDDARAMADVLRAQGVPVTLEISHGRTHVWHLNVGRSPEAERSVTEIGQFIQRVTSSKSP